MNKHYEIRFNRTDDEHKETIKEIYDTEKEAKDRKKYLHKIKFYENIKVYKVTETEL